jgi:hypothetical protein
MHRSSVKHNKSLRQLKEIEGALRPPTPYLGIWSLILQISALLDLLSFVFVREELDKRDLSAEKSKNNHFIKRLLKDVPFLNHKEEIIKPEIHWVEQYQYVFNTFFCACWLIEGLRLAWTKANTSRSTAASNLQKQKATPIMKRPFVVFTLISCAYIFLLPMNSIQMFIAKRDDSEIVESHTDSGTFDYKEHNAFSLPYVIVIYFSSVVVKAAKAQLVPLRNHIAKFVMWNPLQTKRIVSQGITVFKSVKRGLPIFKAVQKIYKKMGKVIKYKKQRYRAKRQRRIQRILWSKMDKEERMLAAVKRLQSNFRKNQAMKKIAPKLKIAREKKLAKEEMVKKENTRSLLASSAKIDAQINEVLALNESMSATSESDHQLDKSLMYQELRKTAKSQKRIMAIIRPNSRFSIIWHFFVFFCIVFENTPKILPADSLNLEKNLEMIPEPITQYYTTHGLLTLNIIYLLDVLVDFFTGKFNDNGQLIPEAVIPRWLPFILKSLGNPLTASFVKATMNISFQYAGPARMIRWLIGFIFPFGNTILSGLIWSWFRLVQSFNGGEHLEHTESQYTTNQVRSVKSEENKSREIDETSNGNESKPKTKRKKKRKKKKTYASLVRNGTKET